MGFPDLHRVKQHHEEYVSFFVGTICPEQLAVHLWCWHRHFDLDFERFHNSKALRIPLKRKYSQVPFK